MLGDDDYDEEAPSGALLPPDDRLWRHPSEVAIPSRRSDTRMWLVALLAGAIGALLATGVGVATGRLRTRTVEVTALEQEMVSPVATLAPPGWTAGESCAWLSARDAGGERHSVGVIFRSDGMVLTTAHSVLGAQSLSATVKGHPQVAAHLIASDADTDLAVVKLDGSGYVPAPLGSALSLRTGDRVGALMTPDAAMSSGSVDAVGASHDELTGLLQIATATQTGGSAEGAPVFDEHGAVVGITTDVNGAEAYAMPVDMARAVAAQLLAKGRVTPVWLGVDGHDLPADKASSLNVPGGAVLDKIDQNSPAADAGLRVNDVILGVDGRVVTSMAALVLATHALAPGTHVTLYVERDGSERTVTVTLEPPPGP